MKNTKRNLKTCLSLTALLALGLLLAGCESDSTAPNDELPALTQDGAAQQAGFVAMAVASVGPEFVTFDGVSKELYTYTFSGSTGISGIVMIDYRDGGSDGDPATFETGDWAHLWTPEPGGITGETSAGGSASLSFDLEAEVTQASDTATILVGSSGSFTSGEYTATFDLDTVVVTVASYPSSGTMVFSSGGFVMTVTYDGDNTAVISVAGVDTWVVNLDDGTLTEIVPV